MGARPEAQLTALLVSLFGDARELRRFSSANFAAALVAELAGPDVPLAQYADEAVGRLVREGRVVELFDALDAAFPRRRNDLEPVAAAFGVHLSRGDAPGTFPPTWNIPAPPPGFVGREAELGQLDAAGTGTTAITQAMTGLGGVGKSTLAKKWASSRAASASLGWWLRAETRELFDEDLLGLGRAMGLLPANAVIEDREGALRSVRAWLRAPTRLLGVPDPGRPWILVVDNAGEPGTVELPVGRGAVLVTSRDRRWARHAEPLTVEVLPPEAARALLQARLTGAGNTDADADALAEELGRLPLALAQAHAYCHDTGVTLARYRERIRSSDKLFDYAVGTGEATVARTWALSVERLSPHARAALEVLAWFAPEDIPVEALFASRPEEVSGDVAALCDDAEALDEALGELHRVCLADRSGDRVDLHRLVQRVTRTSLVGAAKERRLGDAQRLFLTTKPLPTDPSGWPLWRRLAPHGTELTKADLPPADEILDSFGWFRWIQAAYLESLDLQRRALTITERARGPDHPDTAIRLGNLAETLSALGEHREARPLKERALAINEHALGPHHPDTATALDNLGSTLSALGEHQAALPLRERALAITERALGRDHPSTAIRLGNVASTLFGLERHREARSLEERALAITERALGADHPNTAIRLANLASTLCALGNQSQARLLEERALTITERALGADHPDTALRLGNLAITEWDLGLRAQARARMARCVDVFTRALGPDHPNTAHYRAQLAAMNPS